MDGLLLVARGRVAVPPGRTVLKAAEYAALTEADAILAAARREAETLREEARQTYEREKLRGYEEGLRQGKAEMTARMFDSLASGVTYLEKMEGMVVDVVMDTLRKILAGFDDRERAAALVRKAVAYVRGRRNVVLRVAPDDLEAVQATLETLPRDAADVPPLEIVADARLEPGACLLESELGVIDAGLETQLQSIREAFLRHLGQGHQTS